jgi:hypothetical protein
MRNAISWAYCWAQEEQQSAEARLQTMHAQLERAAAARLEARHWQQALHKRCSDASGQLLDARVRASADVRSGRASAHVRSGRAPPAAKATASSPPQPPQAQQQQVTAQGGVCASSVFGRTMWTQLPNPSSLPMHEPLRFIDITATSDRVTCADGFQALRNANSSDEAGSAQGYLSSDLDMRVSAYQHAVAKRLACRVDQIGWWLQLQIEVAPDVPLSVGTACASTACAASMCLLYNLSAAESLALMASERRLIEACDASGAPWGWQRWCDTGGVLCTSGQGAFSRGTCVCALALGAGRAALGGRREIRGGVHGCQPFAAAMNSSFPSERAQSCSGNFLAIILLDTGKSPQGSPAASHRHHAVL